MDIRAVNEYLRIKKKCSLCDNKPTFVGLYYPEDPTSVGYQPIANEGAVVFYVLCEKCQKDPDVIKKIEALIDERKNEPVWKENITSAMITQLGSKKVD